MPSLLDWAVRQPRPPAAYTVPGGAVECADSAALVTALAGSTAIDIVLTGASYAGVTDGYQNTKGHRIYSETLGSATLAGGIVLTSAACDGAVIQGIAFDVSDSTLCYAAGTPSVGSVIRIQSGAKNTTIRDCTIDGNRDAAGDIGNGVNCASSGGGLTIERCTATQLLRNGFRLSRGTDNDPLAEAYILSDLDASFIGDTTLRSLAGTAEFGFYIGERVLARRLRTRRTAWSGVWLGDSCTGSIFDLDCNMGWNAAGSGDGTGQGQAVYCERYVNDMLIQRMRAGPMLQTAIACEGWKDNETNQLPASTNGLLIRFATLVSGLKGLNIQGGYHQWNNGPDTGEYAEDGNTDINIEYARFGNQRLASIANQNNSGWPDPQKNMTRSRGIDWSLVHPGVVARGIYTSDPDGLEELT